MIGLGSNKNKYEKNLPQAQVETLAPGWLESARRRGALRQFVEDSPGLIVFFLLVFLVQISKMIAHGLFDLDFFYFNLIITAFKLEGKWGSRCWHGREDLYNHRGFGSFLNLRSLAKSYGRFPKRREQVEVDKWDKHCFVASSMCVQIFGLMGNSLHNEKCIFGVSDTWPSSELTPN